MGWPHYYYNENPEFPIYDWPTYEEVSQTHQEHIPMVNPFYKKPEEPTTTEKPLHKYTKQDIEDVIRENIEAAYKIPNNVPLDLYLSHPLFYSQSIYEKIHKQMLEDAKREAEIKSEEDNPETTRKEESITTTVEPESHAKEGPITDDELIDVIRKFVKLLKHQIKEEIKKESEGH